MKSTNNIVNDIQSQMNAINFGVQTVAKQASTMVDESDELGKKTDEHMKTIISFTEEQSASNEEIAAASQALSDSSKYKI